MVISTSEELALLVRMGIFVLVMLEGFQISRKKKERKKRGIEDKYIQRDSDIKVRKRKVTGTGKAI